jgi:xylan 1,4-beta-xylosidase
MTVFTCTLDAGTPFAHVWEHTVGSGHATLALRADYQEQLARCHRELGFEHVRFHGLLSDDMGTLVDENDALVYSFFNADQIIDFLLSIGMKPFVELSFMPSTLSSGSDTVFHYRGNITPPRSYDAWATLVGSLVQHWVERYGVAEVRRWFFEVWNEPNLAAFWTGTQTDYFTLYEHAARAIKAVDGTLAVGGPATADNAWIVDFLAFCSHGGVPVDFVSTHHYPTDSFGKPGDDTVAQLAAGRRSALRDEAMLARAQANGKPLYYTEWCSSSNPFDDLHDQPYAAAFIIKSVLEARALVSGYSYWTFTDIFEENYFSSTAFHGGFGLLTIDGIAKPAYRAFEMLHRLGDRLLAVAGSHATVDVWATRRNSRVTVVITNGALPRHSIATEPVTIELRGVSAIKSVSIERIDDDHANAHAAWLAMGQPERPLPQHVAALDAASRLRAESVAFAMNGSAAIIDVTMPPQGSALLTIDLA